MQLLRREAVRLQEIPKYDNKCRTLSAEVVKERLSKGVQSCIRFKVSGLIIRSVILYIYNSIMFYSVNQHADNIITIFDMHHHRFYSVFF